MWTIRPIPRCCSPGTTATAACCRGARAGRAGRSLSRVAVRDHAAADHREGGRAVLRALPGALAGRAGARRGAARRRAEGLGRARLLRARAQPARLRQGGGGAAWRAISRHRRSACATLPGIGAYTAAAIAAIAFDRRAVAVDGNIERVIARLFAVETELPAAKPEIRARAETLVPHARAGDFAQAMMDLGATICTPKKPACGSVPGWMPARRARAAMRRRFRARRRRSKGRLRRGASFVVIRADGRVLVRTPPEQGPARRHDRSAVDRMDA